MWLQIGRTRQASQSQTSRSIKQPKQRWTYGTTVGSSNNKQNTHEQKGQDKVKLRIVLIVKATSNTDRGKESWAELEGGQTKIEVLIRRIIGSSNTRTADTFPSVQRSSVKKDECWKNTYQFGQQSERSKGSKKTSAKNLALESNQARAEYGVRKGKVKLGKMMVGQTTWVVLKPAGSSDERRQNTKLEEYEAQSRVKYTRRRTVEDEFRRMTEEEVVSPQVIRKKEERINKLKREEDSKTLKMIGWKDIYKEEAVEEVWCKGIEEVIKETRNKMTKLKGNSNYKSGDSGEGKVHGQKEGRQ
ncbi:hypothetical protein PPACK8108_LOCUS3158 [Phakopsora pachyrhizi]|uniref:Uncharacterized protein n=1 Tax=Phakopsora pachyrhizi TaxID=170000 RepID=A0AAV0ALZ4_PHAPC|nr:hypothetical protein PPACK8108_LOCUS3158 [Phakopsora pachyrhizi]